MGLGQQPKHERLLSQQSPSTNSFRLGRMKKARSEPYSMCSPSATAAAAYAANAANMPVGLNYPNGSVQTKATNGIQTGSGGGSANNSALRARSISQQHNRLSTASTELISLTNIPELDLSNNDRKSSISFSAVGFMVESMHRFQYCHADKKKDVEKAVEQRDVESLRSLCSQDDAAAAVGALAAIKDDNHQLMEGVLDMAGGDPTNFIEEGNNNDGNGLLHAAASRNAFKCCEVLLRKGFDPNGWNVSNSATPMHRAAEEGNLRILCLFRERWGGDLNAGDSLDGQSVLHAAVRANQVSIVQYLLSHKVNKMSKRKYTETALHTASEHNRHECARLILEDGILVDALRGENERQTALHVAAANGYLETTRLLLKHNADPNAKNIRDETPLHLAAKWMATPVVQLLLEHRADVNSQDVDGRPPLHYAINSKFGDSGGGDPCIKLLIQEGANLDLQDIHGTTALHLAAIGRKLDRVRLLIANGADLCLKNKVNRSALSFLLKYVPNSMKSIEERLDEGLIYQSSADGSSCDSVVKMDFSCLISSSIQTQTSSKSEVSLFAEILQMHTASDSVRLEKILMHPLSLSFLHLKWQQVKWVYYILILLSHLIYAITYSIYVVAVFGSLCKPDPELAIGLNYWERLRYQADCDLGSSGARFKATSAIVAWLFLILFNGIYVMKEITKFVHLRNRYFKEWESVLNLLTIVSFPFISFHCSPFGGEDVRFSGWQFHAAGIGVLITWILQMFLIGKLPKFGKYVQMLINVGYSFLNFFVAYSCLIVGFALSFIILFPKEVSFMDALTAPIKVLVMMTGEIEYNDLYYPEKETIHLNLSALERHGTNGSSGGEIHGYIDDDPIPQFFPFTAHLILTTFILIISIVIMNLLFGMAVSDVQELYKKSRLHQSIQQVQLISYMESMLTSPVYYKLPECALKSWLRRKLHGLEGRYRCIRVEPDSYEQSKLLPNHLNKLIKEKCVKLNRRHDDSSTSKQMHQSMQRLEKRMDQMQSSLRKMLLLQQQQQQLQLQLQLPQLQNSHDAPTLSMVSSLSSSPSVEDDDDGDGVNGVGVGAGANQSYLSMSMSLRESGDDMSDSYDSLPRRSQRESQHSMVSNGGTLAQIRESEEELASSALAASESAATVEEQMEDDEEEGSSSGSNGDEDDRGRQNETGRGEREYA